MKILLFDDNGQKLRHISRYLESLRHTCTQVTNSESMKDSLREKKYDVLVADLNVPVGTEEEYEGLENGFEAIQYVRDTTDEIFFPQRIIVISQFLDKDSTCRLNTLGAVGIHYDTPNGKWKQALKKELEYLSLISPKKKDADIVILTVVDNEKEAFKKMFKWTPLNVENDPLEYYYAEAENGIRLVHCHISVMGAVAASQATARVIELFDPDTVIMCGIAGGRPDKTAFGDIILAETAFNFASGSIEETSENEIAFLPDADAVTMAPNWVKPFRAYKDDINLLREIRDRANGSVSMAGKYNHDISLRIGKIATGPAVIKSEGFTKSYIKTQSRRYIAVDMETYGMYYTARYLGRRYLSIKSVSDHADQGKDDEYQMFAAATAANLVRHYITADYKPCR